MIISFVAFFQVVVLLWSKRSDPKLELEVFISRPFKRI